ncbi:glycosyltransferase family 4 protein [Coprobacter fastidiosus]|uniref:glycosyltransferase family 4 protein n=2 Tax=Coprobacter fastidiosus TaxID=1099853 RepID=UPI00266F554E|nr:glycosyltransferase [Coprobacter fastidiosus]
MAKQKIFVSAYACEPGLGSEIGVGWHWVLEMSKYFDLWVLTRESNRHTIEPWITEHPEYSCIHFLYYDWPKWARFWKKGLRGVRTYYNIWQTCTNGIVRQTMQKNDIHVFHHLTYGNMLWKVSSYGQKQFFIWGPVGGLETISEEFTCYYDRKWKLIEHVRRLAVKMLPLNLGFQKRCKNADLILCKTDITKNLISEKYRNKAVLQTDVAVDRQFNVENMLDNSDKEELNIITVGRLDAWRGFDLCIESVAKASKKLSYVHLTIVGDGSDKARLVELTNKLGMNDKISFTGKVSISQYKELIGNADVVMNASLKEGAVTVSFDSMALGKPLICLDTTGYTRYFSPEYAILIPIHNRKQVIDDLTDGIIKLADRNLRKQMGHKALIVGPQFSWAKRGEEICDLFSEKIKIKC